MPVGEDDAQREVNAIAARVGEQRAVVCHCVYVSPFFASRSRVGMLIRPP